MTVITMKSNEVRSQFSRILDHVFEGLTEIVIAHDNRPAAVIVSYHQWRKLKALQKQQHREAIAHARREMDAGHYFTAEQVEAALGEQGLLT